MDQEPPGGRSIVPAGVQGPHLKTRFVASHPPRTTPKRLTTTSPYTLQVGVKRHCTPIRS